ncbi:MAG: hypothetical protein JO297_04000 [Nitrososphaeraceae archaeon]|nr:hypothetical protein [Nitrososphaeraceae archaeon]
MPYYFYAAAAATGIAGILHLMLFFNGSGRGISNFGIVFLVSGVLQLFWAIPMMRRWGRRWYYIGIGGAVVLITIWAMTSAKPAYMRKSTTNKFFEYYKSYLNLLSL